MKRDPYKHKERFLKWKEKYKNQDIPRITKENSDIIKKYLSDMENGVNVAIRNKKGSRSYVRLNTLKDKLIFFAIRFKDTYDIKFMPQISDSQLCKFFTDMRNGIQKREDGTNYKNPSDFVKDFKSFWHWYQKVNYKQGITISDITIELDTSKDKPEWVYLSEEQVKKLCNKAKFEDKVLMWFLFDTGIRAPTELLNVKVSDIDLENKKLNIRQEASKTFGRKINILLSSALLKEYIEDNKLKPTDYLFNINYSSTNRRLKRLAESLFGNKESLAGEKYSKLSMYDFRHCSCCYWLPVYKSEPRLMYRFGWRNASKIHYYSEFLGMEDNISDEDLKANGIKPDSEKELQQSKIQNQILQERIDLMESQIREIYSLTDRIHKKTPDI